MRSDHPSGWRPVELATVADTVTVGWVGPMTHEYREEGVPFLRSQNVRPFSIDLSDVRYVSPEFHSRISKSRLAPDDVVIVRTGAPGTAAVIPEWLPEANCSDLVIVRPSGDLNSRFLAYVLNATAKNQIDANIVGAVQQHFNVGSAKRLKLLLPPVSDQQAIVHVLGALDDKIELNRKTSETLEQLAHALFKSWFVDFDPVVAKADGKKPFAMIEETAALFPDSFEDSEIGPIPSGWTCSSIGEEARVVGGSTPSTGESRFWENGTIPWITPRDLSGSESPVVFDTSRKITEAGIQRISSGLLPQGTVLLSSRAPIGYLAIANVPLAVNQGFIAMICDQKLSNHYVLRWTKASMPEILSRAGGTTFAEISKRNFRPIQVVVPDEGPLTAFNEQTGKWHDLVVSNAKENEALAALRDLLLPKLLSGEIRLRDAEKSVEEAL